MNTSVHHQINIPSSSSLVRSTTYRSDTTSPNHAAHNNNNNNTTNELTFYPNQQQISETFHALVVFANIQANERINTQGKLQVYTNSDFFQGLWRFISGENRYHNLAYIKQTFQQAFEFLEEALTVKEQLDRKEEATLTRTERMTKIQLQQFIKRSMERIKNAIQIFPMLKQTYKGQAETLALLIIQEQEISDHMERIQSTLDMHVHPAVRSSFNVNETTLTTN